MHSIRTMPVPAVAFVLVSLLPHGAVGPGILAFGLAGLGWSAPVPLTISFGGKKLLAIGALGVWSYDRSTKVS
jgi:hypothetical protein